MLEPGKQMFYTYSTSAFVDLLSTPYLSQEQQSVSCDDRRFPRI